MTCPSWDDQLSAYLDGELPEPVRRAVEAHVRDCPDCSREVKALGRLQEILRNAPPHSPNPGRPERGRESGTGGPEGGAAAPRLLDAALARARAEAARRTRLRFAAAIAACALAAASAVLFAVRSGGPPPPPVATAPAVNPDAALAARVTRLLAEYGTAATPRREAIARELAAEGEPALPHLVYALDSPSLAIQVAATHILGRTRSRKIGELLLDYAAERGALGALQPLPFDVLDEPPAPSAALEMLDAEGAPRELGLAALRAAYERFRLAPREVEILRRIGYTRPAALSPEAQRIVQALRERLRSPELKRRLPAIEAAAALRAEPLIPDLVACLGVEGAREAAYAALREITKQDLPLDAGAWENWYRADRKEGVEPH